MAGPGRGLRAALPATPVRRATINDVADAAGVSRQTVTRAMNDMAGISAATKVKVLDAARDLAYRPSRFGRGLVKAEQRTLGLVLHDLANPYFPELASAVVGHAAGAGWHVLLADTVHADDPAAVVGELAQQVDALVGYSIPDEQGARFGDLPVVQVDPSGRPGHGAVVLDMRRAMTEAVDHLLAIGVRRPVMLDVVGRAGNRVGPSPRARLVLDLLAVHGVTARILPTAETAVAAGAVVAGLLDDGEPFDAVIGWNDLVAVGASSACQRAGVRVGTDVKIIGIDGLSLGAVVTPQLTTVAIDLAEVARQAVDLALGMHARTLPRSGAKVRRRVRHTFVRRESA